MFSSVPGEVCFVYLTLPEDPRRSMFVNFHLAERPASVHAIHWNPESKLPDEQDNDSTPTQTKTSCDWFTMDTITATTRIVGWCLLTGLKPDQRYTFYIGFVPLMARLCCSAVLNTVHVFVSVCDQSMNQNGQPWRRLSSPTCLDYLHFLLQVRCSQSRTIDSFRCIVGPVTFASGGDLELDDDGLLVV